jgi:hypothetical protein
MENRARWPSAEARDAVFWGASTPLDWGSAMPLGASPMPCPRIPSPMRSLLSILITAAVLAAPAAAQCWTNSLWHGLSGLPSTSNGGYGNVDLSGAYFVSPGVLRLDNNANTSTGQGFSAPTQLDEPPLLIVEGETRWISGTNTVGLATTSQVTIHTTAFPVLQVSLESDRIALRRGNTTIGERLTNWSGFHSWRVEVEVATDTARFFVDGQMLGEMVGIPFAGSGQLRITWGNVIKTFTSNAVSDWKRFSFNAAYTLEIGTYCEGKLGSNGCVPEIGWTGFPNLSSIGPFEITLAEVPATTYGILAYSIDQSASAPVQGGYRCIGGTRIFRTPVQFASSSLGMCGDGLIRYNFRDAYASNMLLALGTSVYAQWFYRDPAGGGWGLSNGLQFTICQ